MRTGGKKDSFAKVIRAGEKKDSFVKANAILREKRTVCQRKMKIKFGDE